MPKIEFTCSDKFKAKVKRQAKIKNISVAAYVKTATSKQIEEDTSKKSDVSNRQETYAN